MITLNFWIEAFETVKKENSTFIERADFIGAYYKGQLIGFIKLLYAETIAHPTQVISKIEYRNKYPNNALIAKAVENCEKKGIQYLTYNTWRRGSQGVFLIRNGYEKIPIPRYFVPLTFKGEIFLKLNLHRGIKGIIPEKLMACLLDLRAKWYTRKYAHV